jgi:hypothetical protein
MVTARVRVKAKGTQQAKEKAWGFPFEFVLRRKRAAECRGQ